MIRSAIIKATLPDGWIRAGSEMKSRRQVAGCAGNLWSFGSMFLRSFQLSGYHHFVIMSP